MHELKMDAHGDWPPCWVNFFRYVKHKHGVQSYADRLHALNTELLPYNGSVSDTSVCFSDAESLTQFVITFS